jgi:hypothetical protein
MNTRKTVYNKLFKEETQLAKHEVELATLDEYNRSVFGDDSWITELTDFVNKANDLKKQLQMRLEGGVFVGQEAVKAINKTIALEAPLQKAIKELGLSEPPEFKKNQDKIRKTQSQVNELIKKLNILK